MVAKYGKNPHHEDLLEIFQVMRKYQIRLKPTQTNVEPNSINEVQRLAARIDALSRFMARSADRSLPSTKYQKMQPSLNGVTST